VYSFWNDTNERREGFSFAEDVFFERDFFIVVFSLSVKEYARSVAIKRWTMVEAINPKQNPHII